MCMQLNYGSGAEAYLRFVMYFLQNKALESFYITPTIYTSFLDLVAGSTPFKIYNGALTIF